MSLYGLAHQLGRGDPNSHRLLLKLKLILLTECFLIAALLVLGIYKITEGMRGVSLWKRFFPIAILSLFGFLYTSLALSKFFHVNPSSRHTLFNTFGGIFLGITLVFLVACLYYICRHRGFMPIPNPPQIPLAPLPPAIAAPVATVA